VPQNKSHNQNLNILPQVMINQEEKNDNITVDTNSSKPQDNSNNDPFDAEERLDINIEGDKNEGTPSEGKPGFNIKTVIIVAVLLLPVIYIIYKTMGNSTTQESTAAQSQQIDVAAYENAARANPNFSNLLNLSNAYINTGMAGKAIEPLKKAIELNPASAPAYSNLGFAYTLVQQYKEGIAYGEKAVQLDSTFQLAKNNLNWAKNELKKLEDGLHLMEKTPEDKRDIAFYTNYGLQLLKMQEYDKSIEACNKMLILDPKNSIALINKGVAYMSKTDYDKAIESFQKAIDNNPNDQLAKNNLNWATGEKKKADDMAQKAKSEKAATPTKK
jgi:tetratricopeptide (TPR) repeat protein